MADATMDPAGASEWEAVDFDPFGGEVLVDQAPSTDAQREILAAAMLDEEAALSYNLAFDLRLEGPVDIGALQQALDLLVARHDSLRTSFSPDGMVMVASEARGLPMQRAEAGANNGGAALNRILEEEVTRPFDLVRGPLVRATLLRVSDDLHHLVLTVHHVICDGWSTAVVLDELATAYGALVMGGAIDLPPAPRFLDFARSLATPEAQEAQSRALRYWVELFETPSPSLDLPTDRPRPAHRTFGGDRVGVSLDLELFARMRKLGGRHGATAQTTLFAAFQAFLARICGVDDVVLGLFSAGQPLHGWNGLVGHCVNLLPIRCSVDLDAPFESLLGVAREALLDGQEHQAVTLGSLLPHLKLRRDPSRVPLTPVVFNVDKGSGRVPFGHAGLVVTDATRRYEAFEWFVNVIHSPDSVVLECSYNTDLFDGGSVESLLVGFLAFLRAIVDEAEAAREEGRASRPLGMLPLLDPARVRERVRHRAGNEDPELLRDSFLEWVRARVEGDAGAPAVEDDSGRLWSYGELWETSGRVAAGLAARGVDRGDLVGVHLERGGPMLAALLGVLRVGAAYLPLDPAFPADRLRFMVEDGGAVLVLTEEDPGEFGGVPCVGVGELLASGPGAWEDRPGVPASEDLAYVIYTSGSTGLPKGVEIEHGALRNFLGSMAEVPGLESGDTLLAVTTLSFDISGLELFLPLVVGAKVVIPGAETTQDGWALRERLEGSGATVMQATPATWRMLMDAGWEGGLRRILCGGEALPGELARELVGRGGEVWNMYGPTETTIWSTVERVEGEGPVLVGRPIANTRVYVLDGRGQLVPDGVAGEVWIAGGGVARGYRDRPELTAERFVADPFVPGERMYRTGDLGRWRRDGRLEHLGRVDFQVKVHGYRIELGEIETRLEELEAIHQAVVVAWGEAEDRRLVAYVIFEEGRELLAGEIRRALRKVLPQYMVPGLVVPMEAFPLTPNGKVDRRALPDPLATARVETEFEAPATPEEEAIARVWSELLNVERVGRHDNFFELGGHSLLAIRAAVDVEKHMGRQVNPRDFFFRSLAQLAALDAEPH